MKNDNIKELDDMILYLKNFNKESLSESQKIQAKDDLNVLYRAKNLIEVYRRNILHDKN